MSFVVCDVGMTGFASSCEVYMSVCSNTLVITKVFGFLQRLQDSIMSIHLKRLLDSVKLKLSVGQSFDKKNSPEC